MSLEAIKTIGEAEEKAKAMRGDAAVQAKRMLSEADAAGKAAIQAAEEKARTELAELSRKADDKALESAKTLAAENDKQKSALRKQAESRMDRAVSLIVERIVCS